MTHTYAELEVSTATYIEIAKKLRAAGYDHAFIESGHRTSKTIDMHGIGLVVGDDAIAQLKQNAEETEIEGGRYVDRAGPGEGLVTVPGDDGELPSLQPLIIVVSGPDQDDEIGMLTAAENYLPRATAIALVEELCKRLQISIMTGGRAVQHGR